MYRKNAKAGLTVLYSIFMAAVPVTAESTSVSRSSGDIVDGYHISCASETKTPILLAAPDPDRPGREFRFDTTFSFNPERFVEKDGIQYMEGRLINGAMRVMYQGPEVPEATRDRWYALSSEWYCELYRVIGGKRKN